MERVMDVHEARICVVGLGYVGLPLALEFAKKYPCVGYDISNKRVEELRSGHDHTLEVDEEELRSRMVHGKLSKGSPAGLYLTDRLEEVDECTVYIVTVPTPIDDFKTPDLRPLISASTALGKVLKKGDVVIYESTTYPGCTEEDCVPVLEQHSGLSFNRDFYCGYSPERINPGDKINTLTKIKKVTSGSTPEVADFVDGLYASIITAGTHKAPSMKVAEASKAIENAQRDVNISFVNELALMFDRMGIDTQAVLDAAGTKWNFLKYKPGLVGGHCIGVDPYYLAFKAQALGYQPDVILSGRRVNDNMGHFVANKVIKMMIHKGIRINGSKVLLLGFTFKENCPDIRNTRVIDIHREFLEFGVHTTLYDPWADPEEVRAEYGVEVQRELPSDRFDGIVLAVSHDQFAQLDLDALKKPDSVVFDIKSFLDPSLVDARL